MEHTVSLLGRLGPIMSTVETNSSDVLVEEEARRWVQLFLAESSLAAVQACSIALARIVFALQRDSLQPRTREALTSILGALLTRCPLTAQDAAKFREVFSTLMRQVHCDVDPGSSPLLWQTTSSEELKLEVTKAFVALLGAGHELFKSVPLVQLCSAPAIGLLLSVFLELATKEKNRQLKLEAIAAIRALVPSVHVDVLAFFLPGLVSALYAVTTGDYKQGHAVLGAALDALTDVVCRSFCAPEPDSPQSAPWRQQQINSQFVVVRSEEWKKNTAEAVHKRLARCFSLSSTAGLKLKLAQTRTAYELLTQVPAVVQPSFGLLLDTIVHYTGDSNDEVREAACTRLEQLQVAQDRLQEEFRRKISALPRQVRSLATDDAAKETALRLVLRYIHLVQRSDASLELTLDTMLRELSLTLLHIFTLDEQDERVTAPALITTQTAYPRRVSKWFRDENVAALAATLCRTLGRLAASVVLLDHFLQIASAPGAALQKEALVVVAEVIAGAAEAGKFSPGLRSQVLQELRAPAWWAAADPLLPCLALEVLGAVVDASPAEAVQGSIIPDLLYQVLLQLGEPAPARPAAAYARVTLNRLAARLGLPSISAVVSENSDYLFHEISLHMKHVEAHPSTPRVLLAIFRHCADRIPFALVEDTVEQTLRALDQYHLHDPTALLLLDLLGAVSRVLAAAVPPPLPPPPPRAKPKVAAAAPPVEPIEREHKTPEEIKAFFLAEREKKEKQKWGFDADGTGEEQRMEEDEEAEPAKSDELKVSKEEEALIRCVERTKHFIGHRDPAVSRAALHVLEVGFGSLGRTGGRLFPLIHSVWQPLIARCAAVDSPAVAAATLGIVSALTRAAGDFLLPRFQEELWPLLSKILRQLQPANPSFHQQPNSYTFTSSFRLQLRALECLDEVIQAAAREPRGRVPLRQISAECGVYLSEREVPELQAAAVALFRSMVDLDPDALFLVLLDWSGAQLPPTPPGCQPVRLPPGDAHMRRERRHNAAVLFEHLNAKG